MKLKFLPDKFVQALDKLDLNLLYEIRLRVGFPVKINYKNDILYLSSDGATTYKNDALTCSFNDIDYIINYSTEHSIYAFNDKIKDGFLTVEKGIRIGICGECVYSNNVLQTIKNFTSLNVRIPHEINGCSNQVFKYVLENEFINNTLIISPPFLGKTTLLKDIALKLNDINKYSILIIDERGEFENIKGESIDTIKYCDKYYAFNYGIRSMSPSIIITDELVNESDWKCAYSVVSSGIKIIASCHGDNLTNLQKKEFFNKYIFDKYVFLSKDSFGKIDKVYNREFV